MLRLQRLRDAADPTVIPQVRDLLKRSLEQEPRNNFEAFLGMASLSNARHDFSASVRWARRAIDVNPYNSAPYGVLGDALFELGRYRRADAAYQKMMDTRPDVGAYIRASYAAQFHQNYRAAQAALRLALEAAGPLGEEAAFIHHQLGDVHSTTGDFSRAARENKLGMRKAPGYVPPEVGYAESLIARGRLEEAEAIMTSAAGRLPALEYLITLGDVRWALGNVTGADAAYDSAAQKLAVYRDSGVLPDVDFILFYADRGIRIDDAVEEARAIFANRPTPSAADGLAWALHAAGNDRGAWHYARTALRQASTPDGLHHFHAGVIAASIGKRDFASDALRKAFVIDPTFSLFHRETAQRLLRSLEQGGGPDA